VLAERLMSDSAEAVVSSLVRAAIAGDTAAATFIIRRLVPIRHSYPITFSLPPISEAADVAAAMAVVAQQMSDGKLTIEEASAAANVLETQRRCIETSDMQKRLAVLESAVERQQEKRRR
jgi:hypothetical protein